MMRIIFIIFVLCTIGCTGSSTQNLVKSSNSVSNFFPEDKPQKTYKEKDLEQVTVEPSSPHNHKEEKQTWLYLDEMAPFNGILLNPEAIAYILSEYESFKLRSKAALEKQRQSDLAKINLEVGKLQLELQAIRVKGNIVIRGRDEEIQRLQKINEDIRDDRSDFWDDLFLVIGSGSVGILVGMLIISL
jgi:hypothetical protein